MRDRSGEGDQKIKDRREENDQESRTEEDYIIRDIRGEEIRKVGQQGKRRSEKEEL